MTDWRGWRRVLWAPERYWQMSDAEHAEHCNGCGAAKARFDFVPDTMYGLDMGPVCDIHDDAYRHGASELDRFLADLCMFGNCILMIDWRGGWLSIPRCYRALAYYLAVHRHGDAAFWEGKVRPAATKVTTE